MIFTPKQCVVCGAAWTPKTYSQRLYRESCDRQCRAALIAKRRARPLGELKTFIAAHTERSEGDCLVWNDRLDRGGYGRVVVNGRRHMAHRVTFEMSRGPIPPGLVLDHLCRNRACCNPDHLEPVTHLENVRRGQRAQQTACGRGHPYDAENTVLTKTGRSCRKCHRLAGQRQRAKRRSVGQ